MTKDTTNNAPKHETHTAALVFLTIAAVVVSFVAFSSTRLSQAPETASEGQNTATVQTDQSAATVANSNIPATASELSGMSGFPDGLPLGESQLVENYQMPIETGQTERVLTYETTDGPMDVRAAYKSWLAENGYQVVKEKSASVAASIAAMNNEARDLIVLISSQPDGEGARVQLVTHYAR